MKALTTIAVLFSLSLQVSAAQELTIEQYIATYKATAISEMQTNHIPASITLAQGILESSFGNSYLAREANNHFGIKCHKWTGKKVYRDDDKKNECFRKYGHALQSYRDHSDFLKSPRYAFLFDLEITDYVSWSYGLKEAGYATNKKYAHKLVDLIERYELYQYDQPRQTGDMFASAGSPTIHETASVPSTGSSTQEISVEHGSSSIRVQQAQKVSTAAGYRAKTTTESQETGLKRRVTKWLNRNGEKVEIPATVPGTRSTVMQSESFYYNKIKTIITAEESTPMQIANTYNISVQRLCDYNEFDGNIEIPAHSKIYLEPKRNVGPVNEESVRVQDGQSMESISQTYGIKLKSLYKRNKMRIGTQPAAGEVIYLRGKNPRVPKTISKESLTFNNNRFFHTPGNRRSDRKKEITNATVYNIPEPTSASTSRRVEAPVKETRIVETPPPPVYTEPVYTAPVHTKPEPVYTEPVYTSPPPPVEREIEYLDVSPPVVQSTERIVVGSFDDEPNVNSSGRVISSDNSNRIVTGSYDEPQRRVVTGSLDEVPSRPVVTRKSDSRTSRFTIYKVKPKDTLWALSKKFNISIEELKSLNNLKSNALAIGQELKIP